MYTKLLFTRSAVFSSKSTTNCLAAGLHPDLLGGSLQHSHGQLAGLWVWASKKGRRDGMQRGGEKGEVKEETDSEEKGDKRIVKGSGKKSSERKGEGKNGK